LQDDIHCRAIGIAEETVIKLCVDVLRRHKRLGFRKDSDHFFPYLRVVAQHFQVIQTVLTINTQPVSIFRSQRIGLRQHRTFIDVNQLHRYRREIAKLVFRRVKPFTQRIAVQFQQRGDIARQIHHDNRITVVGMPCQRRNPAGIAAPRTEHPGDVYQRLHLRYINQRSQLLFAAVTQQILKQTRLGGFHQLCHGNGGIDVSHRVVGIAVLDAVGARQVFKPETRQPILVLRPVNAFRTQGITGAHNVE